LHKHRKQNGIEIFHELTDKSKASAKQKKKRKKPEKFSKLMKKYGKSMISSFSRL
jgi:hypothetical protein